MSINASAIQSRCSSMNRSTSFLGMPIGADTCTSPFFTIRIDSLLVLLYVTCMAISILYYDYKNKVNIPIFQTFSGKYANLRPFF